MPSFSVICSRALQRGLKPWPAGHCYTPSIHNVETEGDRKRKKDKRETADTVRNRETKRQREKEREGFLIQPSG